ncbi:MULTISPECIES: sensor domain-containing phosphodiesterase [unclassified Pseudomonas]|uniref:sensor domain-containing phosphodiesterase n=1 Tax=unclassified Pseudomonas TaxID=196821 RepID=UPI002AC8C971|nr:MULTISPECIES: sensor domain-containing phosphodiesterase [unclassified Pseudomonas]MEB0048313.1 sensor domain-containing phosphodiesterase [Pseudomonas sp. Dout3]MEB0099063.1 sensor domain-containing phosphodiesterase [Pseudomonas sp. DC1.2]WPX56963.1 sensor domain-containing phosphodiesterase [Pseudomonas sp. DC1.2]
MQSHPSEKHRLDAVQALEWLKTAESENFDRICRLAAAYFKVPTVLISLVERDRQWFKVKIGFDKDETPIDQSFCAYTICNKGVFQVYDASLDLRFFANPLVTAQDGIRFYAGAPLRTRAGHAIGSLCIIDKEPKQLSEDQRLVLLDLAEMVMAQIEQRQLTDCHDAVSGLPNQRQFFADLNDLGIQTDTEQRVLVLIDALDSHRGHDLTLAVGTGATQSIILDIAKLLKKSLSGISRAYHVNERQFCFMLPAAMPDYELFVHQLIDRLRRTTQSDGTSTSPSPRAGMVIFEHDPLSHADLLRKAMHAVESACEANTHWALYDAARDFAWRRAFTLAQDVDRALATGQMYLVFQPRFNLLDGRQVSAEALLRWNHPELGQVSPAEFIPVLERNGLIQRVTHWVIDQTLSAMALWEEIDCRVSLNLSPKDFNDQDIGEILKLACKRFGVAPERLEIEITEGEWIRANPQVIKQLKGLRDLGMDVAIDDFGTGYSNFAYLHEIPANVIKLDKSIVTDLPRSPRNQIIARSILQLAKDLGYRTVAEGIEDYQCLALITQYGSHEAQGYFFAKPMTQAEFAARGRNGRFLLPGMSDTKPVEAESLALILAESSTALLGDERHRVAG